MIPLAVSLFALIGTYAYRRNELGATWGFTALACCALAAWLVGAAQRLRGGTTPSRE
jgi:hypothetical protein